MTTGASTRPRSLGLPALLAACIGLAVSVTLVGLLATGLRAHGITDTELDPALQRGDAVVTVPIAPSEAVTGDLITFPSPQDRSVLVTQRVLRADVYGPVVSLETTAGGALGAHRWTVEAQGRIGRVVTRIPNVGHVVTFLASTTGRVVLLGVPALGLLAIAFAPRPSRRREPDPHGHPWSTP